MEDYAADIATDAPPFKRPLLAAEKRPPAQIREHYFIEVELADKLRSANKASRGALYTALYDELFRRVPHHQQLTNKRSLEQERLDVSRQMSFLLRYVNNGEVFMEIGAGSCALSRAISKHCKKVVAIDVSCLVVEGAALPANCTFVQSTGCDIPVPEASVNTAYSNQLMEHLHPDDALEQLKNIYKALTQGGRYVCVTPNSVLGPWDISMYFDEIAKGFHLKEYNVKELVSVMRSAGFRRVDLFAGGRGFYLRVPCFLVRMTEWLLQRLPYVLRIKIGMTMPMRGLLGLRVVAWK
jgi:ubiquinone/menaquinone biosynthesis C-methylase UbiE